MFFYIGNNNDEYLTKVHDNLYLDDGWKRINDTWYKGYVLNSNLESELENIYNGYKPKGIWCVIRVINSKYDIYYPHPRGFTLYQNNNDLTNIKYYNYTEKFDSFEFKKSASVTSTEKVISNIKNILIENCDSFAKYHQNINVYCTGGVDSLSIIAIFELLKIPYNIYIAGLMDTTIKKRDIRYWEKSITEYETNLIRKLRQDFWGYEILSNFKDNKIIATGFYGDEYLCRGPHQLNLLANCFNKTIVDFVKKSDYMYSYLLKTHKKNSFNLINTDEEHAKFKIKVELAGDSQIWHLDNTITFCPYFDERIIDNVLSLSAFQIIETGNDATIQKNIIKTINNDLLLLLDNQKNTSLARINFLENIKKVNLKYCNNLIIV